MATRARIKLDSKGIGAMLKGRGVQSMLERKVQAMKRQADAQLAADPSTAGVETDARVWVGFDRARATLQAPLGVEARTGALSRSLDAAR